ncbi:MAG: N-formylglutamate deformylase [Sneathiella sp.]
MPEVFTLTQGDSPLILSQPHPGTELMAGMENRMTMEARLLPDTDWHIPQLYAGIAADLSATVLSARYSRFVADLNRDPEGNSLYPGQSVTSLCPTDLFDDTPIYNKGEEPSDAEIADRRKEFWQPYHDALKAEVERVHALFGYALVYDCHSIRSMVPRFFDGTLPDLNLGTADHTSADPSLVQRLDTDLQGGRYSYIINGRFKGGYITRQYGDPARNIHAVQMEIAQSAYMEESHPFAYDDAKATSLTPILQQLLTTMIQWGRQTYGNV